MKSLEDAIDQLKEFDQFREQAAKLRVDAIAYLKNAEGDARPDGVDAAIDFVEDATQLIAVQHAARDQPSIGLSDRQEALLKRLSSLTLPTLIPAGASGPPLRRSAQEDPEERLPLFVAARALRALTSMNGHGLRKPGLYCYYAILRAFYTTAAPEYTSGGIRAGDQGKTTAFMTGECVHALIDLEQSLLGTADLFDVILTWKGTKQRAQRDEVPSAYREHDMRRATEMLRVHLATSRRGIAFDTSALNRALGRVKDRAPHRLDEDTLRTTITEAIAINVKAFENVITACRKTRVREAARSRQDAERTESAHMVALRGLESGRDAAKAILKSVKSRNWKAASDALRTEASRVRKIMRAAESYLLSVLDREIAQASSDAQQHQCDYAELAFAAAGYGTLKFGEFQHDQPDTEWDDPRLKTAAQLLAERIGFNGRFPPGRPIALTRRGYRLDIVGAEVTRAVAAVLRSADVTFDSGPVRAMLRLFWDTQDPATGGFGHEETASVKPELWTTALCTLALDAVIGMLDHTIRAEVTKHFKVRWPLELKVSIEQMIYGDVGFPSKRASLSSLVERIRRHIVGVGAKQERLWSLILYGPPGTGKTTIVEALAKSTGCPLIEVTPSDLIVGGQDQVERRAKIVFEALSMISESVILFDEFDSVLRQREPGGKINNIFEFLTPGMLPKLKALNDAAEKRRVAYALTTNLIDDLDDAAVRDGRFNARIGIYPPDLLSRTGRLVSEVIRSREKARHKAASDIRLDRPTLDRIAAMIACTAGSGMTQLGKPGWLTASVKPGDKTPFRYIESGKPRDRPEPPRPEKTWSDSYKRPQHPKGPADDEWQEWGFVADWDRAFSSAEKKNWSTLVKLLQSLPPLRKVPEQSVVKV